MTTASKGALSNEIAELKEQISKLKGLIEVQQFTLRTLIQVVADDHGVEKKLSPEQRTAAVLQIIKDKYPEQRIIRPEGLVQ